MSVSGRIAKRVRVFWIGKTLLYRRGVWPADAENSRPDKYVIGAIRQPVALGLHHYTHADRYYNISTDNYIKDTLLKRQRITLFYYYYSENIKKKEEKA